MLILLSGRTPVLFGAQSSSDRGLPGSFFDISPTPQLTNPPIDLLPALLKAWPTGSVKGLRARGGFEVDMAWKDGKLLFAQIKSLLGNPCVIRYDGKTQQVKLRKGETFQWK